MYTDRPSFLAFILQGMLLGIAVIMFFYNYKEFSNKEIINYLLLGSVAVGIHSMLHYREERDYGFNPIKKLTS